MPFVIARPSGARIRTRLLLDAADERVLRAIGEYLARLAGGDLAVRCRLGHGDDQRADRKRVLTVPASSRWAGAITRTSNNQWQRGYANLLDERVGLRRAIKRLQARLDVAVEERRGKVRGYTTQVERFEKQRRLQHLQARLAKVDQRIAQGRVSVCRGGRPLAERRHAVDVEASTLTTAGWHARWQAERLFLTADGEADKRWGNETIRVHPDQHWLEIRLPTSLAHLSNTAGRAVTYRLSCPVVFNYRRQEWAAQAASGAVRYDIHLDPAKHRWYVDASWRLPARAAPSLEELRQERTLGVDLNAGHLDAWVVDPSGNPVGIPHTIPLELEKQPATARDGRLRAAISGIIRLAVQHGCRSITVEDLNFADARHAGRETLGRGSRGRRFRHSVTSMPTRQFRDRLVGTASNAGLWVIAVDAGWTSKWGRHYWQDHLNQQTKQSVTVDGHHAAAVVIGRRGLGHSARRRSDVTQSHRRMGKGELSARPGTRNQGHEGPGPLGGQRAAAWPRKTRRARRIGFGD